MDGRQKEQPTRLLIPKRHRAALTKFIRLSPAAMRGFANSLNCATPTTSLRRLAAAVSKSNAGLESDDAYGIIQMFVSLYRYRSESDIRPEQIAESFISAAKEESRTVETSESSWAVIKRGVLSILKSDRVLGLSAKAVELMSENERVLCPFNCRILTDARPIFLDGIAKEPSAVLLQHTLKIAYHGAHEGVSEFFVTLGAEDILRLQMLLDRAKQKEKSLSKLAGRSGIPILGADRNLQ